MPPPPFVAAAVFFAFAIAIDRRPRRRHPSSLVTAAAANATAAAAAAAAAVLSSSHRYSTAKQRPPGFEDASGAAAPTVPDNSNPYGVQLVMRKAEATPPPLFLDMSLNGKVFFSALVRSEFKLPLQPLCTLPDDATLVLC